MSGQNTLVERLDVRAQLQEYTQRFEKVAAQWKKDRGKLRDLEVSR